MTLKSRRFCFARSLPFTDIGIFFTYEKYKNSAPDYYIMSVVIFSFGEKNVAGVCVSFF